MKWIAIGPAAALAALAVASAGSATAQKRFEFKVGDTVDVVGTAVACFGVQDDKGERGVACAKADRAGAIPGTYGAALSATGIVAVHKINAKREPVRIYRRTASREGRYFRARPGDVFHLQGTQLYCDIVEIARSASSLYGRKAGCYLADPDPIPQTYGMAVADRFVGVFRWKSSETSTDVYVRRQPK